MVLRTPDRHRCRSGRRSRASSGTGTALPLSGCCDAARTCRDQSGRLGGWISYFPAEAGKSGKVMEIHEFIWKTYSQYGKNMDFHENLRIFMTLSDFPATAGNFSGKYLIPASLPPSYYYYYYVSLQSTQLGKAIFSVFWSLLKHTIS